MEELNTPIFAQAKVEYTKQLIEILYPHMFDGVKSIYDESKVINSSKNGTPVLLLFRELLEKVPIWNSEIIDSECSRIINNSYCDWIDDLITAVFISHTKILTSIGPNQSFQKINVTIPKTSTFIHKSYINTARELWKNPYLFNENIPGHEYQKNNKEIENIIKNCIENTIRNLLPIKEILKEHLEGETDNNLLNQKEELKKLLREELNDLKSNIMIEENNKSNLSSEIDDIPDSVENNDDLEPIIKKEEEDNTEIFSFDNNDQIETQTAMFPLSDDPTEDQVKEKCTDIVVNDITIPVDIQEENYDNINLITENIIEKEEDDPNRLKRLMTNMEKKEEINVIKTEGIGDQIIYPNTLLDSLPIIDPNTLSDSLPIIDPNKLSDSLPIIDPNTLPIIPKYQPEPQPQPEPEPEPEPKKEKIINKSAPSFSLGNLYPNMNKNPISVEKINDSKKESLNIIEENKPVTINDELKSPRKDIVIVKNEDDIDETSSLAHFFNDMKQIVEDKGIKIEINKENNYSLFEDADEVEK